LKTNFINKKLTWELPELVFPYNPLWRIGSRKDRFRVRSSDLRELQWKTATEAVEIAAGGFHVWRSSLDIPASELRRYWSFLSTEEKARAERFVFPRDKDYFIAARGTLRELLERYLDRAPKEIELQTNKWGKPALMETGGSEGIYFNLSHSHGMAAYVFSQEGEAGIDIEKIRPELDSEEIAKRYFSENEIRELQSLPAELRPEGFFLCWTRKEAYIKACGEGLGIPLRSFEVSLTPGEPAVLRSDDKAKWNLLSLLPFPGFVAACVVPHSAKEVHLLELHR
jgi:4'-phosphopantetheinyl transferase